MSLIERVLEKAGKAAALGRVDLIDTPPRGVETAATPATGLAADGIGQKPVVPKSREAAIRLDSLTKRGMLTPGLGFTRIAEEYRRIKRPVINRLLEAELAEQPRANIVVVTSSVPNEGKTFTAINLAISIAMELDRTALLVDGDVAEAGATALLGVDQSPGLMDLLIDPAIHFPDAMLRTNIPKFTFMPSGGRRANVSEIYASDAMLQALNEMSRRYDDRVIIIDAPPIIPTAEAFILANLAGQIVFVIEAEKTPQKVVDEALRVLDAKLFSGFVLNKTNQQNASDAYYGSYGGAEDG